MLNPSLFFQTCFFSIDQKNHITQFFSFSFFFSNRLCLQVQGLTNDPLAKLMQSHQASSLPLFTLLFLCFSLKPTIMSRFINVPVAQSTQELLDSLPPSLRYGKSKHSKNNQNNRANHSMRSPFSSL
jgi:hypothetical protein